MKKNGSGYREILRQSQFMKLVAANVVNRLGDSLDALAYTWIVYQVTNSPSWTALIFGLNQLPSILLQPVAGALVERRNKKRVMVVTDVLRGLITLGFCQLYMAGTLSGGSIAAFTLLISSVEAFRLPCGKAVLPQLLSDAHYTYGTSVNDALCTAAQLAGTGLAGVVIALWGAQAAVFADGITFFLSALILSTLRLKPAEAEQKGAREEPFLQTLSGGFRYVVTRAEIRNLALLALMMNACVVPLNSFFAVLVEDIWRQGAALMSAVNVALVAGTLLGSVAYPLLADRMHMRRLLLLAGTLLGLALAVQPLLGALTDSRLIWLGGVACFLAAGVTMTICGSAISVEIMRVVAPDYLSRVSAIFNAVGVAAMPVVSFALSAVCRAVPVPILLISGGILFMIVMGLMAALRVRLGAPEMEKNEDEDGDQTRGQLVSGGDRAAGDQLCG